MKYEKQFLKSLKKAKGIAVVVEKRFWAGIIQHHSSFISLDKYSFEGERYKVKHIGKCGKILEKEEIIFVPLFYNEIGMIWGKRIILQ